MDNKEGKWVTINGTHIFIKDGQTVEDALAERDANHQTYTDDLVKAVSYVQMNPLIRYYEKDENGNLDIKKRIMPKKYCQRRLRMALDTRPTDEPLIKIAVTKKVTEFILKDTKGSDFSQDYWSGKSRMHISIAGTKHEILHSFMHECGHVIDSVGFDQWHSTTFKSPKYGITMRDMLEQEVKSNFEMEYIEDEVGRLVDLTKQNGNNLSKAIAYEEAKGNLVDLVQSIYGDDVCKQWAGYLSHKPGYFNDPKSQGTEMFAELTESLNSDSEATFYNIIKQYCPKTIEIYEEILEEERKKWKI